MKSNKTEKSFFSYFKPILIVSFILIVISAVVLGVFGFNKGFDFTGGTQLVVNFAAYNEDEPAGLTEEENKIANEISNIIKKNNIKINSFQVQGDYNNKAFVITFKDTQTNVLNDIRLEINQKYNKSTSFAELDDYYDITRNTTKIDGFITENIVLTTVSTLLFAIVMCMLYGLFRVRTSGALSIVLAGVLSVVLTACFIVLTRIEINTYFFVALGLVELVSLFFTTDTLFSIKSKLKDPRYTDKNNHEIAELVVKENFKKNLIVGISAVVLALIVGFVGVLNVLKLALVAVVGIAISFVINWFVVPAFWANITKKRELVRAVKVETNDVDNDAEVVEVKD